MKKQNLILSAALAAVFSASTAFAEAEVTGKIVHESAKFTTSGTTIGAAAAHGKDVFKTETSARIYIDGEIDEVNEGSTYHVELNLMRDSKGVGDYDGNESYTQRDALREAYVDTTVDDWSIRAGKQQVVWGTADGMKLLDAINPTDYSEMAQNQMEDSRIPVWMVNAETTNADGSEFQVIVSQPKENVFAGLNRNIDTAKRSNSNAQTTAPGTSPNIAAIGADTGHTFIMKGPDTITGRSNGFLNIAPDLGTISTQFSMGFDSATNGTGLDNLVNFGGFAVGTAGVGGFAGMTMGQMNYQLGGATSTNISGGITPNFRSSVNKVYDMVNGNAAGTTASTNTTAGISITGAQMLEYGFASQYDTNLANYANTSTKDSAFEYMNNATFKTFNTLVNAESKYNYDMPSDSDMNLAFKMKESTLNGVNYSLNYSYNYDQNPIINLDWKDQSGGLLTTSYETGYFAYDSNNRLSPTSTANATASLTTTTVLLHDANGATMASGLKTAVGGATSTDAPVLHFTQLVKRAHNIGGSFDTAIETETLGPIVIRGEALYQKDVYQPVIDKAKLSIGDMTGALTMVKGDRFKYVLGADVTVLTNMMVSAQFIQDRNLDYVDETSTPDANNANVSADKYTADYATMHLTNGFNKAEENKEFYSLLLSKPFGASGEHRWNNIFMFEENGGKWNRLDAEFSIDDDTQVTAEYNKYWGDANTQFGQLEKSSNVQVGFKYSF